MYGHDDKKLADQLGREALRYMYRLLFLSTSRRVRSSALLP